jgi:hypothetical protein
MGSSVEDLRIGMEVLAADDVHHFDLFTAPCPWNNEKYTQI